MEIIALDAHKRYSQVCVQKKNGQLLCEKRLYHDKGKITEFLSRWTAGSAVAIETVGNWYWIVDEIEKAGMQPKLIHAHKAKLMLGSINKTDKLDTRGLNQPLGHFPTVFNDYLVGNILQPGKPSLLRPTIMIIMPPFSWQFNRLLRLLQSCRL